jgi:serine/threonine protein kinase
VSPQLLVIQESGYIHTALRPYKPLVDWDNCCAVACLFRNTSAGPMASNGCEELMQAWFSKNVYNQRKAETDIRGIAEILERTANVSWSRIPRIYSVLRIIDQLQVIECFLTEGVSDVGFPFTSKSLPSSLLDHATRSAFLAAQELVFNTRAQDLERAQSRHGHFRDLSDIPFKKVEELGKGAYGFVDRVVSTISHKEYARKLIPRGKNFRKDKNVLLDFERELSNLKRISTHKHIVQLVASYTDPKYVGIITTPVADCNLHEYLQQQLDSGKRSFLRGFFGCLTTAVCSLHDNKVRHKDIKPQNVLVKGECIFLTDFGLSLDWSERNHSITTGPSVATPRYAAPEVANQAPRNSSADIWSLGCVFLEMWTVLRGESKQSLELHLSEKGSHSTQYCNNSVGVSTWIEAVARRPGSSADNAPVDWIKNMLQREGAKRWTVHQLEEQIQIHDEDDATPFAYIGRCCSHDEDTEGSVYSTCDEDMGDDVKFLPAPASELHLKESKPVYKRTVTPSPSWDLPAALNVSHLFQEVNTASPPAVPPSLQEPILNLGKKGGLTPLTIDTCLKATIGQPVDCAVEAFALDEQGTTPTLNAEDDLTAKPRDADPSPRLQPEQVDNDNLNNHRNDVERGEDSENEWDVSDTSRPEISEVDQVPQQRMKEPFLEEQISRRFPPQPYFEDENVSLARETIYGTDTEGYVKPSSPLWEPERHAFDDSDVPASRERGGNAQNEPRDDWSNDWKFEREKEDARRSEHDVRKGTERTKSDGEERKLEATGRRAQKDVKGTNAATAAATATKKTTTDERGSRRTENKTSNKESESTSSHSQHPTMDKFDCKLDGMNPANKQWVFFSSGSRHIDDCKLCSRRIPHDDVFVLQPQRSVRLRCGQHICDQCLASKIDLAVRYPQHMPPVCGNVEIAISSLQLSRHLDQDLATEYVRKYRAYKSYYPDFCQPTKQNVLVCPIETCKSQIIPSKVRVDQHSGKKFVRCTHCIVPVCLTCGSKFHGGSHCSGFATRPPRWEMCWQICPKCLLPWIKCPCKEFNEGLHDTEDDQDVFPITAEERGYGYGSAYPQGTKETPGYPVPPQHTSANPRNPFHEDVRKWYHPQQAYADIPYGQTYPMPSYGTPNPFADPNVFGEPKPYVHTPFWNNYQAPPQPQYPPAAPPFSTPYAGYYAAPPRQPSPPAQYHTKTHPHRHHSNQTNNIRRDSPLDHGNPQPAAANSNNDDHSDFSEELRPPLRRQKSHRRTRNTMHDDSSYMSTADSRASAVAVINRDRESAQAGLSYDDALNSPERILEWLLHIRIDHDATQQTNWTDEGSYDDEDGYTDSSDTFIESDDDYWDTVEA